MNLADKIIKLRKKNGWSQEDLADKLEISRQSVSKWESEQSLPDVEKIVHMSKLFGVTTDYLLNEEIEVEEKNEGSIDEDAKVLNKEDVASYIKCVKKTSVLKAVAVGLAGLAAFAWFLFEYLALEQSTLIGGIIAGVLSAGAVGVICTAEHMLDKFKAITSTRKFTLGFGVQTYIKDDDAEYHRTYAIISTICSVISVLMIAAVIVATLVLGTINTPTGTLLSAISFLTLGFTIAMLVLVSSRKDAYKSLLKEGDFSDERYQLKKGRDFFSVIYLASVIFIVVVIAKTMADTMIMSGVLILALLMYLVISRIITKVYENRKEKEKKEKLEQKQG